LTLTHLNHPSPSVPPKNPPQQEPNGETAGVERGKDVVVTRSEEGKSEEESLLVQVRRRFDEEEVYALTLTHSFARIL